MNLGDVLRELGDAPLKDHTWTQAIVSTLNAILPVKAPLTGNHSGREALQAMVLVPEPERDLLLASEVDLLRGTLTLAVSNVPAPSNEAKSETFHQTVVNDLTKDPTRNWVLAVGMLFVLVALGVATYISNAYQQASPTHHTSFWKILWDLLQKVLAALGVKDRKSVV